MPAQPPSSVASADTVSVPERLLSAALELVRTEGMRSLSQARVAAAAGLRQSHLTYYFPTRRALLQALIERIHLEIMETVEPLLAAHSTPAGQLDRDALQCLRAFLVRRIREPLLARLMLALANMSDEDPVLRDWLAQHDREMLEHLREVFHRMGLQPSESDLGLFHATFIGLVVLSTNTGDPARVEHYGQLAGAAFDRLAAAAISCD
ncbi:MAG: TetR/AcrR family transcriptional regulator [Spongiibacteraceae bacterium]|nr:TetR/AcrR family transcriptional regulator [Spongiibacteraceae bacterium]